MTSDWQVTIIQDVTGESRKIERGEQMSLKEIRVSKGLTQQKLSDLSGVAREVIARTETGKTVPELQTIIRLAKALDCSIDDLVNKDAVVSTAS